MGDMIVNIFKVIGIVSFHALLYTILLEFPTIKQHPTFMISALVISCIMMIRRS